MPTPLVGLVHDHDRRVHRDHVEQCLDVLRIETHAAVRHLHADTGGPVRSVDQVGAARYAEPQREQSHRIVRSGGNDLGQYVASLCMLLAH